MQIQLCTVYPVVTRSVLLTFKVSVLTVLVLLLTQ